jgi:mannose-6-phosphate isomerase-like protein (cupin superfamily)
MSGAGERPVLHGGARRLPVRWRNVEGPPPITVSRYEIAPGEVCSLHVHTGKTELWLVVSGEGTARIGPDRIAVAEGDIVLTPPLVPHELVNTGAERLVFVNIVHPTGDVPITTTEIAHEP